jgi:tetratricopeptide (TPR) repeat protein
MRVPLLIIVALVCVPVLGGCAQRENISWQEELRSLPLLQKTARVFLTGQIYDHAIIALRDGNESALQNAQDELQMVAPLLAAEQAVRAAIVLDSRAQREKNEAIAEKLRASASKKYREALSIDANFDSTNPDLLNALGYYLAERGTSTTDFQTAEKLTRRALALYDQAIASLPDSTLSPIRMTLAQARYSRAVGARDSLAWSLFRQRRYGEALKEQKSAVDEAAKNSALIEQPVPADLYYHQGEIYRALNKLDEAQKQYSKALDIEPDHQLSLRAKLALKCHERNSLSPR